MKRKHKFSGHAALSGAAAATLIMAAPDAAALGLGRLSVQSSLGEALQAEIEVTSMTAEEAANLRIRVAPPEAYRSANVDYNAVLPSTRVTLQRRPDGRQFVRLTSDRGVQEPFVDVILEISWATGRLVREYTLLFDPPTTARAAAPPAPTVPPVATRPAVSPPATAEAPAAPPMTAPAVAAAPVAPRAERRVAAAPPPAAMLAEPRSASALSAPSAPSAGAGADEYRVRPGDSLSRIAGKTQRPGVSLDQMLVALFRTNPQAFISNNMNRLKSGVVLAVPTADAAQAITAPQAREVITAQSADFGAYRQRLAGNTMPAAPEGTARQSSGKVQASVEDRKQPTATTPDRLTLSKGAGAAAGPSAEEERLAKERERKAAEGRVAELSKNVDQLKKLQGAAAASAAATPGTAPAATAPGAGPAVAAPPPVVVAQAPAPAAPPPAPAPAVIPAPVTLPATPAVTPPPVPAASAPAVAAAASSAVAKPAASAVAAAKPAPAATKPATAERDLIGSMMDDNPLALGVGALLVALLAGFGIYRVTQRAKKNSGETSFLESRLQPDSFFGASGGQRIDTRDAAGNSSSMTYSLSQLDAIGDVDPVAEADVYLAYGRDLQAEEILKEAMRSSPERLAIRTKLLEVYAKRRDTKGFELLATQLYGLTRGEGEDWAKAQELGADIDPGNAMYQPGGAPPDAVRAQALAEPLGGSTQPHLTADSQFGQTRPSFAPTQSVVDAVDLDLDDPEAGSPSTRGALDSRSPAARPISEVDAHEPPAAATPAAASKPQLDEPLAFDMAGFSLDLDTPAPAAKRSSEHALQGVELPSLDLDTDGDGDPMQRKLELAEEFRQIGDKDGARDLLREVLANASGVTKSKAQTMLDDLS